MQCIQFKLAVDKVVILKVKREQSCAKRKLTSAEKNYSGITLLIL